MILSRQHNFIFLKTAKTAGTSFEIALSAFAGPDDIITPVSPADERLRASLGYRGAQNHHCDDGELGDCSQLPDRRFYNHATASEISAALGAAVFERFLKVSIVRNPYDLVVSRYFWENRELAELSPGHFKAWLLSRPPRLLRNRTITHIDGRCVVDVMIRYESFGDDIPSFADRVGLPDSLFDVFSSLRAKGQYRPKQASTALMFDGFAAGRALVEDMFAEDIARYGYGLAG